MAKQKLTKLGILCAILICVLFCAVGFLTQPTFATETEQPITVYEGKYDSYTDTDMLIANNNYQSILYRSKSNIMKFGGQFLLDVWGDDPIINIVPKELFTKNGDYMYIGREYGFFVSTFSDTFTSTAETKVSSFNKHSYVLVFDINNNFRYQNTDTLQIKVSPIFQYEYAYITQQESTFTINQSSGYGLGGYTTKVSYDLSEAGGDNFVVPSPRKGSNVVYEQETRYYLKDIAFGLSLANEQEYNAGDPAYRAVDDDGFYFLNFDYKYSGIKREHGNFINGDEALNVASNAVTVVLALNNKFDFLGNMAKLLKPIPAISGIIDTIVVGAEIINYFQPKDVEYSNGKITATYLQSDLQSNLIKSVGAAINTENEDSVWYKVGNECSITAQTTDTAKNHPKNQTRLMREIGIKVVDVEDSSTVQGAVSSARFDMHKRDKFDYEEMSLDSASDVILLPHGQNYFKFAPMHSSEYRFRFSGNNNCTFMINGETLEKNGEDYVCYLSGGTSAYIEVNSAESGWMGTMTISPDASSSFTLKPNAEYLVKVNSIGIRTLTLSDENAVFKTLYSDGFVDSGHAQQLVESSQIFIKNLSEKQCYVLIKNHSEAEINVTLADTDVPLLDINVAHDFLITSNDLYLKFIAPNDGTYYLSLLDGFAPVSGWAFDENFQEASVSQSPRYSEFFKFTLNAGNTLYFKLCKSKDAPAEVSGDYNIVVKKFQYNENWYVERDGKASKISGSALYLYRGESVILYLLLDDVSRYNPTDIDWGEGVNREFFTVITDPNQNVNFSAGKDCPFGKILTFETSYVEKYINGSPITRIAKLEIFMIPPRDDYFLRFRNDEQLGFYWKVVTGVTGLGFSVSDGHGFNASFTANAPNTPNVAESEYYCDLLQINYLSYYDLSVRISTIYYVDYKNQSQAASALEYVEREVPSVFATGIGKTVNIAYGRHFKNIGKVPYNTTEIDTYLQTEDINCGSTGEYPLSKMIFRKTYDGQNKTVESVYIDSKATKLLFLGGFCGTNEGSIKNIKIAGIIYSSESNNVGGLIGLNSTNGVISNCTVSFLITSSAKATNCYVGGVAGSNIGSIFDMTVMPTLGVSCTVGGIVGLGGGHISNSRVKRGGTNNVLGRIDIESYANIAVGGIIGKAASDLKMSDCRASIVINYTAPVSNDTGNLIAPKIGGCVGWSQNASISNSTFNGTINTGTLQTLSYGFLGLTKFDQKQNVSNYIGFVG